MNSQQNLPNEKADTSNTQMILEQWKTCVEMANSVSQRRDTMNNWFTTINIGMFVAILEKPSSRCLWGGFLGIAICLAWSNLIRTYRTLNSAKFDVINKLEEFLPSQPFSNEWTNLKNCSKYRQCTSLENCLVCIFALIYVVSIFYSITQ